MKVFVVFGISNHEDESKIIKIFASITSAKKFVKKERKRWDISSDLNLEIREFRRGVEYGEDTYCDDQNQIMKSITKRNLRTSKIIDFLDYPQDIKESFWAYCNEKNLNYYKSVYSALEIKEVELEN